MLRDEYAVKTATEGETALELIDDSVDVVLLDREMPGLSGDEVAAEIRDRDIDARIVLLTAVEPDVDIIELGIEDYLTKPVDEDALKDCIAELLEWEEYDDPMQDFFALSNKREVLLEQGDSDLESDQLSELEQRITQKAEEGLQKNREVLETLIQSSPAAIVTLDTDGKVDIWNPSAEDIFEWQSDEVAGELPPIFTEDARDELETIRNQLFTDSIITDLDISCVTKSGVPLDISLSAAPLYDDEGSMYGMMFLMVDITDRKQNQQRLNVLSRVLRHNLRNDMNVISGRVQALYESMSGPEAEHMEAVIDVAEELIELSEKARDVQKILSSEESSAETYDLKKIVEQTVNRVENEYPEVEVTEDIHAEDTTIIAGEGISIAIWNLVENAIQHNDSSEPEIKITVTESSADGQSSVDFSITDNGPGIPREETTVIDRGAEDALSHGSGIGLWVVKWILDRSGADLLFEINDMGGTTATVMFRRKDDDSYRTTGINEDW